MASAVIFATIVTVVSAANYERRPFLHYSEYLQKALPNHWQHDKEELNRHVESLTRLHQVAAKPARPPLRDPVEPKWTKWARDHRWRPNTNKELQNVRKRLLQEKLRLNYLMPRRENIPPQPRPEADRKHVRHKREVDADQPVEQTDRAKRHVQPEVVMQPHNQAPLPQNQEPQYQEKVNEKRDKRQILVLINQQQPLMFVKNPRTTPNPFIRETNIDDYEIIHPNPGEGYRPEPGMGKDSEVDSYQLSETSELEYESDYTISMSDSEDWDNYPLTTPSGPNPGWRLSTLADIYQKPKRNQKKRPEPRRWRWSEQQGQIRVKRSPKERKPRIGERKEKLKQRRKKKEIRKRRRIIRNSKEDKAVKEEIKDEQVIKNLLQRPRKRPRKTSYHQQLSREILWSNDTHRIVEDKDVSFEWLNKTHYAIYKENATDDWYKENHVLVYDDDYWTNKTKGEQKADEGKPKVEEHTKKEADEEYSEEYDEDFTKEEEEERKLKDKQNKKRRRGLDSELNSDLSDEKEKKTKKEKYITQEIKQKKEKDIGAKVMPDNEEETKNKDESEVKKKAKNENKLEEKEGSGKSYVENGESADLGWEEQIVKTEEEIEISEPKVDEDDDGDDFLDSSDEKPKKKIKNPMKKTSKNKTPSKSKKKKKKTSGKESKGKFKMNKNHNLREDDSELKCDSKNAKDCQMTLDKDRILRKVLSKKDSDRPIVKTLESNIKLSTNEKLYSKTTDTDTVIKHGLNMMSNIQNNENTKKFQNVHNAVESQSYPVNNNQLGAGIEMETNEKHKLHSTEISHELGTRHLVLTHNINVADEKGLHKMDQSNHLVQLSNSKISVNTNAKKAVSKGKKLEIKSVKEITLNQEKKIESAQIIEEKRGKKLNIKNKEEFTYDALDKTGHVIKALETAVNLKTDSKSKRLKSTSVIQQILPAN